MEIVTSRFLLRDSIDSDRAPFLEYQADPRKVIDEIVTGNMTWKTILGFVLFATLLTSIVGWLTATEILPLRQDIQL